jgi:hypothetical protein
MSKQQAASASGPERPAAMTPELQQVIELARLINEHHPEQFDFSFTSLLLALYGARNTDSLYVLSTNVNLQAILSEQGLSVERFDALVKEFASGRRRVTPPTPLARTQSASRLLSEAQRFCTEINGNNPAPLDVRHLLGAYIFSPKDHVKQMENWGFHLEDLANDFLGFIETKYPAELAGWKKIALQSPGATNRSDEANKRAQTEQSTKQPAQDDIKQASTPKAEIDFVSLPGIASESAEGIDRLGVEKEAEAFANVICSRDLKPPLAIGLFGDWGSGKSFFMGKLRDAVKRIAGDVKTTLNERVTPDFYDDIVQIEFNAWHYADTNLWASLVTHIFESLDAVFASSEKKDESKRWNELVKRLYAHNQLKAAAQAELNAAEEARLEAAQELTEKQKELTKQQTVGIIESLLKSKELKAEVESCLRVIDDALGSEGLRRAKEDWRQMIAEAKTLQGHARVVRRSLARGPGATARFIVASGVAVTMLAFPIVLPLIVESQAWQTASIYLSEIGTAVGGALAWLIPGIRRANSVMRALATLEEQAGKEEEKQATELRKAEQAVEKARLELEQQNKRIQELRSELESLRPSQRLATFLRDRAESADYRKHLGILALVRKDFDRLGGLMKQQRDEREEPECVISSFAVGDENQLKAALEAVRAELKKNQTQAERNPHLLAEDATVAEEQSGEVWRIANPSGTADFRVRKQKDGSFEVFADSGLPAIDRIVLFIDDLDRCPPKKVVEVLQAIHLMLAFPLFVVVVGVDARWIRHSLKKLYPDLLQDNHNRHAAKQRIDRDVAASPRDYLEKIFHIPYWLRPMDTTGRENLLNSLLEDVVEAGQSPGDAMPGVTATTEPRAIPLATEQTNQLQAAPELTNTSRPDPPVDPKRRQTAPHQTVQEKAHAMAKRAEKVKLERAEMDSIQELKRLTGRSPRAVKRFVNVYRLIRAGMTGDELDRFLGRAGNRPEYHAVLVLLTLVNSLPTCAQKLLADLINLSNQQVNQTVRELETFHDFIKDLSFADEEVPWNEFNSIIREYSKEEKAGLELEPFLRWASKVWRYSFHYERD